MKTIKSKFYCVLRILLLAVFLPVLCCVCLVGDRMDYYDGMKLMLSVPNQILFVISAAGLAVCIFRFLRWGKVSFSEKNNGLANLVLLILFTGLYFVNVKVTREIAFELPWDIMVVKEYARMAGTKVALGYDSYLSIYSNNIPVTYLLGKLYEMAESIPGYPYISDFIWLQVNCILVSVGGYFSCLTVKKLTERVLPVAVTFFLYLVLVGISPWKTAPYTDTYGMIFPVMCVYFYVSYQKEERRVLRYLYIALAILTAVIGGTVKPSVYILLIAVMILEILGLATDFKRRRKIVFMEAVLIAGLLSGAKAFQSDMIREMGLIFNPEIEASWHHYLNMGLNEEKTGGYSGEDAAIFGEFQTSKSARNEAALERAGQRLKERGVAGTIYFWLRKLVMTFNDGTFGWGTEVWMDDYYPEDIASFTGVTQWLRERFWPEGEDRQQFYTLCQMVWIFCILGIPGICLYRKETDEEYDVLILGFLGITFYQMLFEARARYLFVFLPLLISISVCGMWQYSVWAKALMERRKLHIGFRGAPGETEKREELWQGDQEEKERK